MALRWRVSNVVAEVMQRVVPLGGGRLSIMSCKWPVNGRWAARLQSRESVTFREEKVDDAGKDDECAVGGLDGVVEIDDGSRARLATDGSHDLIGRDGRIVITCQHIPIDELIALLMERKTLTKRRLAVRRTE